MINLGGNNTAFKVGADDVSAIYLGADLVYSGSTPTPTPTPYNEQYLTMEMVNDAAITLQYADSNTFYYSVDDGATWSAMTTADTLSVSAGDKVLWKASGLTVNSGSGIGTIKTSGVQTQMGFTTLPEFNLYGNIMSLVYGDNFSGQTTLTTDYQFNKLFSGNTYLEDASNLILPATTLSNSCYRNMLRGCRYLTAAPALPATTLSDYCYAYMFRDCSGLTESPVLSAATLPEGAYSEMFLDCSSLSSITCYATDISSAPSTTDIWVSGVAANGTFHKAANMCDWTSGTSGIPNGWTIDPDDCIDGGGGIDWGDAE